MTGLRPPGLLEARAWDIMEACGGPPHLQSPATPATSAARDAYNAVWYLMHARYEMRWLHQYRSRRVESLAHGFRAYRQSQARARAMIRGAGDYLAKAEVGLRALEDRC